MARAYERYAKIFGAKTFEHPPMEFKTEAGLQVVLLWKDKEYRAYEERGENLFDMYLGSVFPENLKKYIMENF